MNIETLALDQNVRSRNEARRERPTEFPVPAAIENKGPDKLSERRCFLRLLHAILELIVDEPEEL